MFTCRPYMRLLNGACNIETYGYTEIVFSSSFLFLSSTSSSRLMTLRFSHIHFFSLEILFFTRLPSPPLSIVNGILSKINLLSKWRVRCECFHLTLPFCSCFFRLGFFFFAICFTSYFLRHINYFHRTFRTQFLCNIKSYVRFMEKKEQLINSVLENDHKR